MKRSELQAYLDGQLCIDQFQDYCPNGLQVQGRDEIHSVLCAATANLPLCNMAAEGKFDAILCHHGFFWKGESPRLTGVRYHRIKTLVQAGVNLFAYHLPLDVHPRWGNNAALADYMGWRTEGSVDAGGVKGLLFYGRPQVVKPASAFLRDIADLLGRPPVAVGREDRRDDPLGRIAWCTGAAEDFIERAAELGVDAYISGEISLPITDLAREMGILYIAAGHHATERYGVQSLANHIKERFQLRVHYCEQDNPV